MDPILKLFRQHPRDGWSWTLNPTKEGWNRDNALALANCSLLAYSDPKEVEHQLLDRQFKEVIPCNSDHKPTDTQAFVAVRSDAIVVAFRGTEPTNARDFATDLNASQIPFEAKFQFSGWGQIHAGWADGVNVVLGKIEDALKTHDDGTRSLWIAGHSLGGALAIVTAAVLANVPDHPIAGVFTFGQPRVGDPIFRDRYAATLGNITFRCVNDRDLVPHLPPRVLSKAELAVVNPGARAIADLAGALVQNQQPDRYEHAGKLRLLLPEGGVSRNLDDETVREPDFLAVPRTARSLIFELPLLLGKSPKLLKDHAPINSLTKDGYVERIEALPGEAESQHHRIDPPIA